MEDEWGIFERGAWGVFSEESGRKTEGKSFLHSPAFFFGKMKEEKVRHFFGVPLPAAAFQKIRRCFFLFLGWDRQRPFEVSTKFSTGLMKIEILNKSNNL